MKDRADLEIRDVHTRTQLDYVSKPAIEKPRDSSGLEGSTINGEMLAQSGATRANPKGSHDRNARE